jgi:predicted CXXCH cytochrome family protein
MCRLKAVKAGFVGLWVIAAMLAASGAFTTSAVAEQDRSAGGPATHKNSNPQDFVGSETCKNCHEVQFNNYSKTSHSKLVEVNDWKDKFHGCETCHGPGRQHVEAGGDKSLIRTFENEPAKRISETCLYCHAGREEHNNFRRGEHWRNDVGCTDCHAPHPGDPALNKAESITFVSDSARRQPNLSALRMLRMSEPQLCLECHNEMKAQFTQPFRHRVLEGMIRCSDCHNPHGGFEQRQARLSIGTDATCIKCHTDKQGPFVYEHAPVKVEGCAVCHEPHGSANPRMMRRAEVFQLCLECHTNAHEIGTPGTPSFHNLATPRFRNCTTCHVRIHGSNTHPFFFL